MARNANQAEGNSWWEYGIPTAENPNGTRKIAYRFDDKQQTVCIKANDEDEHILSFYVASENDAGKQQTVKLYKAGTKEQIGEAVTINKFMEGKYITTRFRGSVDVVFTNDVYKPLNTNALLNGIFFDTHYEGEIPVRKLSITPADGETIRNKGEEVQMTATIYPENATNQTPVSYTHLTLPTNSRV